MRQGIHHGPAIPRLAAVAAHALGRFHPDPQSFGGIGQVRLVEDAQQDDARVFRSRVEVSRIDDPSCDQERERRDASDESAVVIMDLHQGVVITERIHLPHVRFHVDERRHGRGCLIQRSFGLRLLRLGSDHRNYSDHVYRP